MNISNIIYYHQDEETGKRTTLSLRALCMRDGFDIEAIFFATKEATDAVDLLYRIRTVVHEPMAIDKETNSHIRLKVCDADGKLNYLKFKKVKEQ